MDFDESSARGGEGHWSGWTIGLIVLPVGPIRPIGPSAHLTYTSNSWANSPMDQRSWSDWTIGPTQQSYILAHICYQLHLITNSPHYK